VNRIPGRLIVLGLVAALAWLLRRGSLGALAGRGGAINVETAVALGERRSLVIVSVEGAGCCSG
jgi:flagellar biogenesis protein FliO